MRYKLKRKALPTVRVMFGTVRNIIPAVCAPSPTWPSPPPDELGPETREAECVVFRPVGDVITASLATSSVS